MKKLTVILLLSIPFAALCQTEPSEKVDPNLYNHWVLTKLKNIGEQDFHPSFHFGGAYKNLILYKGGHYERIVEGNNASGKWKVKNDTLGFYLEEFNAQVVDSISYSFKWEIIEVDFNKLILYSQGICDGQYYYYEPKTKN